jgi:hypothetical protein
MFGIAVHVRWLVCVTTLYSENVSIINDTNYGTAYIIFSCYVHMSNKIYCDSCKREIKVDDARVSLKKEDGTNCIFDSYICAEIFQKLDRGSSM